MESDEGTGFSPFVFTYSPRMTLNVEKEQDLVPAMLQVEYLAAADGNLKQQCATSCLQQLGREDLSPIEQQCLAHCNRKLSAFYLGFYA